MNWFGKGGKSKHRPNKNMDGLFGSETHEQTPRFFRYIHGNLFFFSVDEETTTRNHHEHRRSDIREEASPE